MRQWTTRSFITKLSSVYDILTFFRTKKFREELIAYFPLIRYESHRKRSVQQFFYRCVCVRCCGNLFTEPLPSNDKGDTHKDKQTLRESRLTTEELLNAVFSLMSDSTLYKKDNSRPGRPIHRAVSLQWPSRRSFSDCIIKVFRRHVTCQRLSLPAPLLGIQEE
jgi:hypothetical protein